MKKLSKKQSEMKSQFVQRLQDLGEKLEEAVVLYNDHMATEFDCIQKVLDEYNTTVKEAIAFADDITEEGGSDWDDKPESWRESSAGQANLDFLTEWVTADLGELEIEQPEGLDAPLTDAADILENLPEEADE